jgi:hypothetical protein
MTKFYVKQTRVPMAPWTPSAFRWLVAEAYFKENYKEVEQP